MIPDFANHAANERTFLAWVRTGVAVIALGFVIEKFNIFLLGLGRSLPEGAISAQRLERLIGPFGHYGGFALTIGGVCMIVFALLRFIETRRRLRDGARRDDGGVTLLALLATLLFVAGFSAYLAIA